MYLQRKMKRMGQNIAKYIEKYLKYISPLRNALNNVVHDLVDRFNKLITKKKIRTKQNIYTN